VVSAAAESVGAKLRVAATTAELTDGAARTVKDNLVLAVIVDVDEVCLPTAH
jgi:hypothetical protein